MTWDTSPFPPYTAAMPAAVAEKTPSRATATPAENRVNGLDVFALPRVGVDVPFSPDSTGDFPLHLRQTASAKAYSYAAGNSLNESDPTGLGDGCAWWDAPCHAAALAAAAAAAARAAAAWVNEQANTHVVGWCINGSAGVVIGVTATGCIAANAKGFGLVGTYGGGLDLPGGADVSTGPMVSDAHSVSELGGPFEYGSASVGEGIAASAEIGGGEGPCGAGGRSVHYAYGGAGVGVQIPIPISAGAGVTETKTKTWNW
jgi:hypothetical protein